MVFKVALTVYQYANFAAVLGGQAKRGKRYSVCESFTAIKR